MTDDIITLSSEDETEKKSAQICQSAKKKTKIKVWRKDEKLVSLVKTRLNQIFK